MIPERIFRTYSTNNWTKLSHFRSKTDNENSVNVAVAHQTNIDADYSYEMQPSVVKHSRRKATRTNITSAHNLLASVIGHHLPQLICYNYLDANRWANITLSAAKLIITSFGYITCYFNLLSTITDQ